MRSHEVRNRVRHGVVSRAMLLSRAPRPVSLRMRLRARLIRLAMLLSLVATAGSLAACAAPAASINVPVDVPGTGPLVTVTLRGGECPEGTCENRVILERDGRAHDGKTPPTNLGVVPAPQMDALTAAINQSDYADLKSRPFTGECPVNFDGQEMIFEFATLTGTQTLTSCQVDIDWGHPLFIAIANAMGAWLPLPLT